MSDSVKAGFEGARGGGGAGSTIRVVSARTGLSMETLRAWERRYGFPLPERRPGSNRRLYAEADVERLLAIQRALGRGYRVGDVIDKSMIELEALAASPVAPPARVLAPAVAESGVLAELVRFVAEDRVADLEAALRAAAGTLGARRFVTEIAHPLAVRVGDAWAEGRISVRHEHVATECLVTQLRQMLAGYQDIAARPLVLLATLPEESHTLALQMVALYLVVAGAKPRLLGGPTPPREIAAAARSHGAGVVGLTVTPSSDRRHARAGIRALRKALPAAVRLWVGGGAAEALGPLGDGVEVVTSWAAIDRAVADARGA